MGSVFLPVKEIKGRKKNLKCNRFFFFFFFDRLGSGRKASVRVRKHTRSSHSEKKTLC